MRIRETKPRRLQGGKEWAWAYSAQNTKSPRRCATRARINLRPYSGRGTPTEDNALKPTKTIAIVGAGASGTLTAYQLAKRGAAARIVVIDSAPEFGPGLAYSTTSPRHLLNVPAGKISALPSQPDDFLLWLRANGDPAATDDTFAPRAAYGRYLQSIFADAKNVEQRHTSAVDLTRKEDGYDIALADGAPLHADYVVLATGNFPPAPFEHGGEKLSPRRTPCLDPWLAATYEGLHDDDTVTLLGTGLTAIDALLRLREEGFVGKVVAVSRHGRFPSRHAASVSAAGVAVPPATPPTCHAYLRAFRAVVRRGTEWRAAIDSLRATTNDLWQALPAHEQLRFRRHLQSRWNVARHRVAASVADIVHAELTAGTLLIRKGRLVAVAAFHDGLSVALRDSSGQSAFRTSRVILCAGPNTNYQRTQSPLLAVLFNRQIVTSGLLGEGFNTSRNGAIIDIAGNVSTNLFCVGPARLGTLLESTAIREIALQAIEVAEAITRELADL